MFQNAELKRINSLPQHPPLGVSGTAYLAWKATTGLASIAANGVYNIVAEPVNAVNQTVFFPPAHPQFDQPTYQDMDGTYRFYSGALASPYKLVAAGVGVGLWFTPVPELRGFRLGSKAAEEVVIAGGEKALLKGEGEVLVEAAAQDVVTAGKELAAEADLGAMAEVEGAGGTEVAGFATAAKTMLTEEAAATSATQLTNLNNLLASNATASATEAQSIASAMRAYDKAAGSTALESVAAAYDNVVVQEQALASQATAAAQSGTKASMARPSMCRMPRRACRMR